MHLNIVDWVLISRVINFLKRFVVVKTCNQGRTDRSYKFIGAITVGPVWVEDRFLLTISKGYCV